MACRFINLSRIIRCAIVLIALASPTYAISINLGAVRDASLFQNATGTLSGGGDEGIFVGRTGDNLPAGQQLRRGLISFDLSTIPANATINSVSLKLVVTKNGSSTTSMTLHRLTGDWGEGNVNVGGEGGIGGTALTNDATWIHQFRPGDPWTTPGGDFAANASATAVVGSSGTSATWTSAGIAADVQNWVIAPATNFGWLIRGNEASLQTARRFASSEFPTAASRPVLTVDYSIPVTRTPGDMNNDSIVNLADAALMLRAFGATTVANDFNAGDFSGDGTVGLHDLMALQRNLAAPAASPMAVPEPTTLMLAVFGGAICVCRLRCRREISRL